MEEIISDVPHGFEYVAGRFERRRLNTELKTTVLHEQVFRWPLNKRARRFRLVESVEEIRWKPSRKFDAAGEGGSSICCVLADAGLFQCKFKPGERREEAKGEFAVETVQEVVSGEHDRIIAIGIDRRNGRFLSEKRILISTQKIADQMQPRLTAD